jgi:hypothetical protein
MKLRAITDKKRNYLVVAIFAFTIGQLVPSIPGYVIGSVHARETSGEESSVRWALGILARESAREPIPILGSPGDQNVIRFDYSNRGYRYDVFVD